MPQAIAAIISVLVGPFGLLGGFVLNELGIPVSTGIIGQALGIGPKGPRPSDGQLATHNAVESRKRNYGIVHTGGLESFFESSNGTLAQVITLGTGEESDILEHRLYNRKVTLDGSGTVIESSFHGAIHIYTRSGSDTQTAISQLTAKFPEWTSNHRQRGCAHAAIISDPVKQKYFIEVFRGQKPAYTQVRKGVKVYDPRKDSTAIIGYDGAGAPVMGSGAQRLANKSTWGWSDNGALVIADYVTHPDGYGLGAASINWANIAAEADICDETVTTVTAATIARWRIWASYGMASEERRQVLEKMRQAVDAFFWQGPDFKFNLKVGAFEEPDLTLTDDHILTMSASLGPDAQDRASALKMIYTEAGIGYREQESALVSVPGVDDDPNTAPNSVPLYYAPHHNQAVRVGKLMAARLGERWHISPVLNLFGLNLLGRRFCRVRSAVLNIDAVFAIDGGVRINPGKDAITIVTQLVEVRAEDWDFDAVTEEGTPPIVPDDTVPVVTVPVPTGLALSSVQIVLAEGNGVAIEASWSLTRADLAYRVRYRPTAGGTWVFMAVDNDALTARSGPVSSGTEYEVQIEALTIGYLESTWSASVTITPTATTTLAAPTSLSAANGTGSSVVTFRMPTSASLSFARLYHNTVNTFGTATQVGSDIVGGLGEVITVTHTGLAAGTEYYWARAFDGSGGSSALAGPVSATIS